MPIAATGALAGFGVGYLVAYFNDIGEPALFSVDIVTWLLPFLVLGVVALAVWMWKPVSNSDMLAAIYHFWLPFLALYMATYILYWLPRI
jgi:hypothetical protein